MGASTIVSAISNTEVVVRFVGTDGSQGQPQLTLERVDMTGDPGARVELSTIVQGAAGEFLVNDTTLNNQMFPSVGMSAEGDIVITWTSAGQDGDPAYETNIYAKQFVSNDVIRGSGSSTSRSAAQPGSGTPIPWEALESWGLEPEDFQPKIVTVDSPINHEVAPGSGFDGVVELLLDRVDGLGLGSGSLLWTGQHILTAAHNVADDFGNLAALNVETTFELPTGDVTIDSAEIFIHPEYRGFIDAVFNTGADLAIIVLESPAPAAAERYDINRTGNEIGAVFDIYGYGTTGTGDVGAILPAGTKRTGQNRFEVTGGSLGFAPNMLWFDFDNGLPANDAMDVVLGLADLGLGNNEVNTAPGDSGGPSFIGGVIAAITSGGVSTPADVDPFTNSSFGEFSFNTRVSAFADWIDEIVSAGGPEFLVNQPDPLNPSGQKWSDVSVDHDGDFVITWTSYGQDGVGTGYGAGAQGLNGIYARRFNSAGSPLDDEFQVNTFGENDQQFSRVAMDSDGDFTVVWESFQDRPLPPFSGPEVDPDEPDSFGVFAQRYIRYSAIGSSPFVGPNGEIGNELPVNSTKPGDQRYPGVAVDDTGDIVIVWSGPGRDRGTGLEDPQGIFMQRYEQLTDEAGPTVTDAFNAVDTDDNLVTHGDKLLQQVLDGAVLQDAVTQFVINFGEALNTEAFGTNSVLNTNNWLLTRDGETVVDGVASVEFMPTETYPVPLLDPGESNGSSQRGKYEAVLTFDADPLEPGNQPLGRGVYVLTARDRIEDIWGNRLDGNRDGIPGGDYNLNFSVLVGGVVGPEGPGDPDPGEEDEPLNDNEIGRQDEPAVATAGNGDHVVVWTTYGQSGDGPLEGNIVAQRYNRFGQPVGSQFIVNTYTTGHQSDPDVAVDTFGNFVITWSGEGPIDGSGVFARVFDAFGNAQDDQFRVNQFRQSIQDVPRVAMDATGDFVVTWTSYGQDGDKDGVYARRYNSFGVPTSDEFRVNTTWANRQEDSDVAMDSDGNFAIVWASDGSDDSSWGIYGQRFATDGTPQGGEFRLNSYTTDKQVRPKVAMDADGDFVAVWQSFGQDGSGYGIYARRYDPAGNAKGAETRVNQTTEHWQMTPAVDMDVDGNYVVTWSSFNQDNQDASDYGIYARMLLADGSDWVDPSNGLPLREFRVNATVDGNQVTPDIGVDADGDFTVVWVGPDADGTGIFGRVVGVNPTSYSGGGGGGGGSSYGGGGGDGDKPPGPATLIVTGTTGADLIEVTAGPTALHWVVKLNGETQTVASNVVTIQVDGRGGDDSVLFTGSAAGEIAELWGDHGTITSGTITLRLANVEHINAEGAGGHDTVRLHDGDGNDVFGAWSGGALMSGPGVDLLVRGFETSFGYAEKGFNVAKLYDSRQDDLLVANFEFAQLTGGGLFAEARNFDEVHTYAVNGGFDTARLYDSAGNDVFTAGPTESSMSGLGTYNRVKGFEAVHGFGGVGVDVANLGGSAGNDTLRASPTEASMYGTGYYTRAKNFDEVNANAGAGYDEAFLFGSDRNDLFVASPAFAGLSGPGYNNQGRGFERVVADGSGAGLDEAKLFDSSGNDVFAASPSAAILTGTGYQNEARGFDGVHAYASTGFDTAKFFDSAQDDRLVATPTEAYLYNNTGPVKFFNRAKFFDATHAYANGGMDEADLYGLSSKDVFRGDAVDAALYSLGSYYNRAKDFERVRVHGNVVAGDAAELTGATVDMGFTERDIESAGAEFSRVVWLLDFAECKTRATSGDPLASHPVDVVLSAYWS